MQKDQAGKGLLAGLASLSLSVFISTHFLSFPSPPLLHLLLCSYVAYGSSTELVITFGEGVHVFSYDPTIGEFIMTRRNVRIPEKPQRVSGVKGEGGRRCDCCSGGERESGR